MTTVPTVGYYVHHQGSGHLHRAAAIAAASGSASGATSASELTITGLSTAPRPRGWTGDWVQLADDAGAEDHAPGDLTAGGRLHYVPTGHPGLSTRMNAISTWIQTSRPALMVVDVSVEVALLARLHGVRVVTVAQPGRRTDPAHRLGYAVSDALLAPWPSLAGPLWGVPEEQGRAAYVGAISRFAPVSRPASGSRRIVVLNGTGGVGPDRGSVSAAARATPGWDWQHLDRACGQWSDDPFPLICAAAVVVSHAGQNAVAEIAAARRPAIIVPQDRPFDEQRVLARALAEAAMPVLIRGTWPRPDEWPDLIAAAAELDGGRWEPWNDGRGAARAAQELAQLAAPDLAGVGA